MTPTAERIAHRPTLQASKVEKSTIESRKETSGLMVRDGAPEKRGPGLQSLGGVGYTAEEKNARSIEALMNGGTCEACQ